MKNLKFDGTQLKYIAIIAMTIDHLAWLLYPGLVKETVKNGKINRGDNYENFNFKFSSIKTRAEF